MQELHLLPSLLITVGPHCTCVAMCLQEPEALQNGGSVLMDTHSRSLLAYPAGSVCNAKCRAQVNGILVLF